MTESSLLCSSAHCEDNTYTILIKESSYAFFPYTISVFCISRLRLFVVILLISFSYYHNIWVRCILIWPVLWIGIVLMPIRIRLSVLMLIRILILPQGVHMLAPDSDPDQIFMTKLLKIVYFFDQNQSKIVYFFDQNRYMVCLLKPLHRPFRLFKHDISSFYSFLWDKFGLPGFKRNTEKSTVYLHICRNWCGSGSADLAADLDPLKLCRFDRTRIHNTGYGHRKVTSVWGD